MGINGAIEPQLHTVPGTEVLLSESARSRVYRVRLSDDRGAVIKEFLGNASAKRLRHERSILERLAGVPGVPQLSAATAAPGGLVIEDLNGTPLTFLPRPLDLAVLIEFAPQLAHVVAAVHARGVVHKDITPANILLVGEPPMPYLIDFDLATTFAEERPGFTHASEITGTLAYLAPEQTGRTGRPVDHRADLYGFGATLYELATGRPPFDEGDPLEMIHDHLARVPVAPIERNPSLPPVLSQIILRLLEKEPDQRYQSGDGLAHDLTRLCQAWGDGRPADFALAERDFRLRLAPPSRLIGRATEISTLRTALDDTREGRHRSVLVGGDAGIGKTMLLDELRPMVTTSGGWLVTGKFDQYRQGESADAVHQALRALVRLLLAEPESEIIRMRSRLRSALGAGLGLIATSVPELATMLQVPVEPIAGDPLTLQARILQAQLTLVRTVASRDRPVVLVLDDLQWAALSPLAFVDAVLTATDLPGVLLVGAYRRSEVDAAHPLTAMIVHWDRLGTTPTQLHLGNLPRTDMTTLLADMLRMPAAEAGPLADAIDTRTNGNPYDTVELVNALRRDGALTLTADDWAWDAGTLRRHLGAGDVIDLLHARIDTLPPGTRRLLEAMACLGGELPIPVLATATAMTPEIAEKTLLPALEDGLLVMVAETGAVRFRHDRVQQAALARVDPSRRDADRLQLARRLAARPRFGHLAAEQYLHAVAHLTDPAEIDRAIQLFRAAAAHARSLAGHVQVEQYMAAATELARGAQVDSDTLVDLATERHAALYNLGRSDEVDQVFKWITELTTDPLRVAPATWVQISSLTDTGRPGAALALGRDLLGRLGLPPPEGPEATGAAIGAGTAAMYGWAGQGDAEQDLARPEYDDPIASALARTIDRLLMPAYWADHATMAWLIVESARMWADHGPHPVLIGMLGHAPVVTVSAGEDYRTGATLARRALVVGEARGYEPATSQGRFWYVMNAGPWWDPLETVVQEARRAREGLIRGGELHFVPHSFYPCLTALTDCAATLEDLSVEVDAALAMSARNSNQVAEMAFLSMRQFVRALRGETDEPGGFADAVFDETAHLAQLAHNPPAAMGFHYLRAVSAALFDDAQALERHSAAAMELLPFATANYPSAVIRLVRGLALANRARATEDDAERSALLGELAQLRAWTDARAADAPSNFRHLVSLLDAERAWAEGRFEAAAVAYDTARRQVGEHRRPWHQALITERAARFHLDRGIRLGGLSLLAEARAVYAAWGADGKVADLEASFPGLPAAATGWAPGGDSSVGTRRSGVMSSTQIDLLGVLKASQALSSETNLDRLRHRVGEVLSALTGATAVQLVLWNHDAHAWFVPSTEAGEPALSLQTAADRRLLPLSAFNYAERTREPLVVDDVTQDYRFNRDPYLAAMDTCSLLVVPILNRGELPGVLILENRLSRAAFSSDRLDAVMLIAGQLAVSLDNALLYASLEQKVAERTDALAEANTRLQALSITDPLTGLANRRRMADVLEAEWQRAQVTGQPMAVAMVDVDHFKAYNDHYGHPAGDLCLRRIAAILNECVRNTDLVVRYGGEEFMLILPGADTRAAQEVAQRARDAVVALQQPHQQSNLGVVTVSIGVTSARPSANLSPQELIEAADHQLYSAKRAGRNQVSVGQTP